ncbi:MAG: PKD domain-containing protein [Saprospiraceae bacterium]|nr:PKD domain-containing protein [Saprospiraceae bacterium]
MTIGFRGMAFSALLLLFFPTLTTAQTILSAPHNAYSNSEVLGRAFKQWKVYQLDAPALSAAVKNQSAPEIRFEGHNWRLDLRPSRIISPDYTLQVISPEGKQTFRNLPDIAFKGYETNGGGRVRLTLTENFIYGYITEGQETYYIEPLWYHEPDAAPDLFVVYENSDVIPNADATCAVVEMKEKKQHFQREESPGSTPETISACYELDLAIASDKSMHTKYMSSVTNVQNHNIGVINNVQGDYTGEFNNDIQFNIVTQLVITGTDPWSSTTDPNSLLVSFRNWGNGGGFGVAFDLGELWTNRNFDESTVGVAYVGAVCSFFQYHCLQDYTSSAQQLRCMTSHEIGHNFDCNHDPETGSSCPPNFIMCPFVSTTTTWSNTSRNSVNSFTSFLIGDGCLTPCSGGGDPLVADFNWLPNPACQNQAIQFTDLSTGNVTGRSWTFASGAPASSTQQNPIVTWNNAGTYNVTLTVTGPGGPSSITKQVLISPKPTANFTFEINGNTLICTNTSTNANSYLWNFGNGFTSTDVNPQFTYPNSGTYTVTLTATNNCGTSSKSLVVKTAPTAGFVASPQTGCVPMNVQFTNQSVGSGITNYAWQFPGGTPATSTAASPTVTYFTAGTFDVSLTVTNSSGSNTLLKEELIVVQPLPTAGFTWVIDELNVQFTNTSTNATSYTWDFGDGNFSTEVNPNHSFTSGGTRTVTLTVSNICGSKTFTRPIQLEQIPEPAFTSNVTSGCGPLTVTFSNQSSENADAFEWLFPGGNPGTSSDPNPTVVYTVPGTYAVSLTVENSAGTNTLTEQSYITVNGAPATAFNSSTAGLTATFTNTSVDATSYLWDFGDGSNTSTETNPVHLYAADGVYTVTLTATNACGSSTSTQNVNIVTVPTAAFVAVPTNGCAPLSVQFINQSSSNATSFQWAFPGGNPATSTISNPVVVYATPGVYPVTFIAGNAAGADTIVQENIITVNDKPTASFQSSSASLSASFTNTSVDATSYLWNFGDGSNTSTATSPVHLYAADGVYTVTLTAFNICGSHISTQTIVVISAPLAGFIAIPTLGCSPLTVQFSNQSSSNATTFQWQFPGGVPSSSTEANPVVVYPSAGSYTVSLTAGNSVGSDVISQSNVIEVLSLPTVNFSVSTNGATATFSNSSQNSLAYFWDFGDTGSGSNNSTEANPTHHYAQDGNYTVTLTVTNNCGAASFSQIITIATPPTAQYSAGADNACLLDPIQFQDASSANATSVVWTFEGGQPATSTASAPLVSWSEPGVYSFTLTAVNATGSDTTTGTVTISGPPEAGFSGTIAGLSFIAENTSVGADSYFWNFGDPVSGTMDTSTLAAPIHHYNGVGSYLVTLIAANTCGLDTFSTMVVIAGDAPLPAFSTGDLSSFCAPAVVQYNDLSIGEPDNWFWEFPGGDPATSIEQNPVVTYSQPGSYNVNLTSGNIYGDNTTMVEQAVVIGSAPTSLFEVSTNGNEVVLTNLSTEADAYFWDLGDGDTSTLASPDHMYLQSGTYTIVLIAYNDCGSDTFALTQFLSITGISDLSNWNNFRLFPNPNTGQFTITMSGLPQDRVEFVLFNTLGQQLILEAADFSTGSLQHNFDVRYLPAAMYTLRVRAGGQSKFVKIALQR